MQWGSERRVSSAVTRRAPCSSKTIGARSGSAALEGFRRFELPKSVTPRVVKPGKPVEVDLAHDGEARLYARIELWRWFR